MTDIEQKALALLKKCVGNAIWKHPITRINRQTNLEHEALCRAIEQHEAFRQEVSDAVADYFQNEGDAACKRLCGFIIPKPKPDRLVEIIGEIDDGTWGETKAEYADKLRAALKARGLEIREKGQ